MSDRLKCCVLQVILDKDAVCIDQDKYQKVISAIAMDYHVDDICSYIFRNIEKECLNRGIPLTDNNIVHLLSTTYCVNRAYEYLVFLQNEHEYAHLHEQEFLAR